MKKFILIFVTIQSFAFSQEINYGITSSFNMNTITTRGHNFGYNSNSVDINSESSYNFGIVALLKLNSNFALNTSLLYAGKIVSTKLIGPGDGNLNATLHFYYISFSPKLEYNPIFGFYFNAGPSIDFNVDTRKDSEDRRGHFSTADMIRETEDIRFGLLFSFGYKYELTNSISVAPEFSYDMALTDTNPNYGGKYSTSRVGLAVFIK